MWTKILVGSVCIIIIIIEITCMVYRYLDRRDYWKDRREMYNLYLEGKITREQYLNLYPHLKGE